MAINIGILIYDEAEVLDFSGPFEVFSTASRISIQQESLNVFLVAKDPKPVVARGGFVINPHFSFMSHPTIDVLVVAGGAHTAAMQDFSTIMWVSQVAQHAGLITSVCTGAFILGVAGLLTGKDVTTHWEDLPDLKRLFPELNVVDNVRWVEDNGVMTSAGISAGIDMSLHIVSLLMGQPLAELTAKQMDYTWQKHAAERVSEKLIEPS